MLTLKILIHSFVVANYNAGSLDLHSRSKTPESNESKATELLLPLLGHTAPVVAAVVAAVGGTAVVFAVAAAVAAASVFAFFSTFRMSSSSLPKLTFTVVT
eukprot:3814766-Amphidinium_carterae.1